MNDVAQATTTPDGERLLPWPPPGLARIQGDLPRAARKMTVAGAILVLPLIGVLALPQSPYGLGPLGNAWWIALVTTLLGVGLFAEAVVAVVRLLTRVRRALDQGYSRRTVGLVLCDRDRDNGHLMQGAHAYAGMSEMEREGLARMRFWSSMAYLTGSGWLVVGFGVLLLVAARGWLTLSGLLVATLVPCVVLFLSAGVMASVSGTLLRRARRAWHKQPWASDLVAQEIATWQEAGEERGVVEVGDTPRPTWITPLTVGLVGAALIAAFPAMTLVPASSVGAILGSVTGFTSTRMQQRVAEAEAYRSFVLEPDPSITALEAGEILQVLAMVGEDDRDPLLRAPLRSYDEPFIPEGAPEDFNAGSPEAWGSTIWDWVDDGLTAEQRDFLERAADNPARAEFSRLARAAEIDVIGGRYELPFPRDLTFFELPWVRFTSVRAAADTHLAMAALYSAAGRDDDAEAAAREVVSVGMRLVDDSPGLIGNLIGARMAKEGGQALANAMRRSGHAEGADLLVAVAGGSEAAVGRMARARSRTWTTQEGLLEMPDMVLDENMPLGLRWEFAHIVPVVTACLNLRKVVFGPDETQAAWVESARQSLVRNDSDAQFFDLAMGGMTRFGNAGVVGKLLALPMGGHGAPGTCGHVVAYLPGDL